MLVLCEGVSAIAGWWRERRRASHDATALVDEAEEYLDLSWRSGLRDLDPGP